jgi:O-antigen/teichoic acid export membrane protein
MTDRKASIDWLAASPAQPLLRLAGRYREAITGYLELMAGTFARLGLQAVYFFALVNALTLSQMGSFAAISAAGLIAGAMSGFGFSSFAFIASAGRQRLLGRYLGTFYASLAVTLPLTLAALTPVYLVLFRHALPFWAFAAIITVECATWRLVQVMQQINNGLGHYRRGSSLIALATGARASGAILFALTGGGTLTHWALIYFLANLAALLIVMGLFHPSVRLRVNKRLFVKRFKDGMMYCTSSFAFSVQNQLDKLIVLSLADAKLAGIYAIATRLLDFTAIPFRTFYVMFTRKLIREGRQANIITRGLTVEAVIAVLTTTGFGALIGVLSLWPHLLGPNVAKATPFFAMMISVPAFKSLIEFHGELFYVSQRMTPRAILAVILVVLNTGVLALLTRAQLPLGAFGLWLNALYAALYALSAVAVYRTMAKWSRR